MTVIPFDPRRRRAEPDKAQQTATPAADPPTVDAPSADTPSAEALDAPRGFPLTTPDLPDIERRLLREAVRRIEQLERSLIEALRENASNWARAEDAERQLRALTMQQRDD